MSKPIIALNTPVFHKAESLRDRTFIGLLIAQFLAAFNDQAIHAAAMFFAISKRTMPEQQAISLMPILFFAPWAMFPTLAGYFADKYSKKKTLVFWKFAEIAITGLALVGFILGSETNMPNLGAWIVLSTVFLMGTHSTFFVPAKYGAMPEILPESLLSRGNGVLESLSFLATIFGTVAGGYLSYRFKTDEYIIGIILVALSVIGSLASLVIREMPPAQPDRKLPRTPGEYFGPLLKSLAEIWRSRPLRFALVGIAFFTFLVAFMRAAVYMFGESRLPRWTEYDTSLVVGMTALGIGLGSPLAGWLSGKKIELGLLPVGGVGMVIATCIAGMFIDNIALLISCIIAIGFFTGFYLVPLFTLQQHRAPKKKKGEVIATFNFTNVVGAIAASLLFFALVEAAHRSGISPRVAQQDEGGRWYLTTVELDAHHRPVYCQVESEPGVGRDFGIAPDPAKVKPIWNLWQLDSEDDRPATEKYTILLSQKAQVAWDAGEERRIQRPAEARSEQVPIIVTSYKVGEYTNYVFRLSSEKELSLFDNRHLPRYLFLGAGAMTLGVLVLLWIVLPDLPRRTRWLLQSLHKARLRVYGSPHLPDHGPVILITDAVDEEAATNVCWASDRQVHFMQRSASAADIDHALEWLAHAHVVALGGSPGDEATVAVLNQLRARVKVPLVAVLPVACNSSHVKFGERLDPAATAAQVWDGVRAAAELQEE